MIIISLPFLGEGFTSTAFLHAGNLAEELGLDNQAEISAQLNGAKDPVEFKTIYETYFGKHIKIKL